MPPRSEPAGEPTRALARILVVEDEKIVARDLSTTLTDLGYSVVSDVATGEGAIWAARSLNPDLVLMDIRLQGRMDGVEAAATITRERTIPIIYLTAHSDSDTLRRAKTTAPFGYLVKPFSGPELRCAIEIALHRHQIDASLRERERQLAEALRSVEDGILARDQEQSPLKSPDQETPGEIDNSNRALERQVVERTQQLEAANKELEAFSYSVAHDLRAPLRGIDGFSQALIESHAAKLGPEGLEHLRHLRGSAKRMSHLIEDLLRLSRVARSELKRTRVDLSQQARAIRDDLITSDKERNVVFTIQDGVSVEGDEQLLRIVLENLLRNAWKFTANKPQAQIHFGSVEIDGRSVCQVKDNGAGFDSAYAHKLFRAFQRLHTEREFEGTGIGLAIVHRIVTRHGGRIWAEAAPDVGATFSFSV